MTTPNHMPASKRTCPADHAPQANDGQAPRPVPSKAAQLVLGQVSRACHLADCPPGIHTHSGSVVNGELAMAASRLPQRMHLSSGNKVHTLAGLHWALAASCLMQCTAPACPASLMFCVSPEAKLLSTTLHLCPHSSSCGHMWVHVSSAYPAVGCQQLTGMASPWPCPPAPLCLPE